MQKHIRKYYFSLLPLFLFLNLNICSVIEISAYAKNKEEFSNVELFDEYLLGPGDILTINIIDAKEYSGDYKILSDGTISFPLIGRIMLNNLSLNQAVKRLRENLSNELLRTDLYLTIKKTRPIKVSVLGLVEMPGIFTLTNSENLKSVENQFLTSSGPPTLIDAVKKAGGISQSADLRNVILMRRLSGINQGYKETKIDLLKMFFYGDQSQNPYLFDGDIIKFSKAEKLNPNLTSLAKANFSPESIKVNIQGEVLSPGLYEIKANTPLSQALMVAGGPKAWKSDKTNIQLIRLNRDGSVEMKKFVLNLSEGLSAKNNPPLTEGDIVRVGSSLFGKTNSAITNFTEPISGVVSVLTLFKLLE